MSMQRFVAPSARDCLRKVKTALGPDAIVVSNKPVSGGVEIMAMTAEAFEALSRQGCQGSQGSATRAPVRDVPPVVTAPATAGFAAQRDLGSAQATRQAASATPPRQPSVAILNQARQAYAANTAEALSQPTETPRKVRQTPDYLSAHDLANARERVRASSMATQLPEDDDYRVRLSGPGTRPVAEMAAHARPAQHDPVWREGLDELRPRLRPLPDRPRTNATPAPGPARPAGRVAAGMAPERDQDMTARHALPPGPAASDAALPPSAANATLRRPAAHAWDGFEAAEPQMENRQVAQLMGEMQTIKALLERQLAGFAWGEMSRESPVRALVLAEMLEAGFSAQLARRLGQDMPAELDIDAARKWLQNALNRRLRTLGSDNDIIDRGGVFALVGPTGVGKTTTTAKLAARCVVRYGADKIALLTTDGYRIGAHEQLRIYGRILGVPVHVVRDGEDLRHTLADLRDKHMVLIDTVGMSQRDRMVAEQAAMLARAGDVQRLLLLNATNRGDTLDDVIRAYAGEDLAGVILSKVDETASIAPALDAVIRHGLTLCYIANGQRVPEDMHLPNRNYLLHRAFKQPGEASAHRLQEDEAGMMLAGQNLAPGAAAGGRH